MSRRLRSAEPSPRLRVAANRGAINTLSAVLEAAAATRAQGVVGSCGGRGASSSERGGYGWRAPVKPKPVFDSMNIPAFKAVCTETL